MKLNLLFLPVFLFMAYCNGFAHTLAFLAALFLHESAHGIMAAALGAGMEEMELLPFGCAAHIGSFAILSGAKEIAMAAAGPAMNLIAAAGAFFYQQMQGATPLAGDFLSCNLFLAAMNLLPVLTLDGGRMLSVLLSMGLGQTKAIRIAGGLGIGFSFLFLGVGGYALVIGKANPTMLCMGGFLLYSSIQSLQTAECASVRRWLSKQKETEKKGAIEIRQIAVPGNRTTGEILAGLEGRKYTIVSVLDDEFHVVAHFDEAQLMGQAITHGSGGTMQEMSRNYGKI